MAEEVPVDVEDGTSITNIVLLLVAILVCLWLFVFTGCECGPNCKCGSRLWCKCKRAPVNNGDAANANSVNDTANANTATNEGAISSNKPTIYYHYTTWCGYCKKMKPIWADVKSEMGNVAFFIALDEDVAKTPNISSYPTVMAHVNGQQIKYDGGYTKNELVVFVQNAVDMANANAQ